MRRALNESPIVQAIEDAEYKGKTDLPYYPH